MVNVETITRLSNVITLKGISAISASDKKIRMIPIVIPDGFAYIDDCSASMYSNYKNGTSRDRWGQGIRTVNQEIDIVTPYNNGAKYIYVLSTGFKSHTLGMTSTTGPVMFFKKSGNTYSNVPKNPIVVKTHAIDYNVANNNEFDNMIIECYYPLDIPISGNATFATISFCAKPGPYTASGSTPYTFSNTIIDKPIAYFIHEE